MMDILTDNDLLSGSGTLDAEHNLQLNLLIAFRRAVADGDLHGEATELLDRFYDFSSVHYASEETLMRLYQYAHFESHAEDHRRTLEQLQDIRANWRSGQSPLALEQIVALLEGTVHHIKSSDRAFADYLLRLGLGPG